MQSIMSLCQEHLLWLELALTPELSPRHVPGLLNRFGSIDGIYAAGLLDLGSAGLSPAAAAALAERAGRAKAEAEAEVLEKNNVSLVRFGADGYPKLLEELPDPPTVLFYIGEVTEDDFAPVGVVGSRSASAYGTQAAHRLSGDLAARGVTVVSGMARGIDQAAHNGTLEAGGRTIAVLGSGLGKIYPPHSDKLIDRITANGAVVTEFCYSTPPSKGTFPQRNRIISGMSYAVLVVEASERSGALITARYALDQNRELLAVPGPISSRQSIGTNYMIKKGAKLVQRAQDIIDELPPSTQRRLGPAAEKTRLPDLTEEEKLVLAELSVDRPQHVDIIANHLGAGPAELSAVLLSLEMKALVKQLPGMEYVKTF